MSDYTDIELNKMRVELAKNFNPKLETWDRGFGTPIADISTEETVTLDISAGYLELREGVSIALMNKPNWWIRCQARLLLRWKWRDNVDCAKNRKLAFVEQEMRKHVQGENNV